MLVVVLQKEKSKKSKIHDHLLMLYLSVLIHLSLPISNYHKS